MKKTKTYEVPRILRVMQLSLEQGICNNSPFTNGSTVSTTGQQVQEFTYGGNINSDWQ